MKERISRNLVGIGHSRTAEIFSGSVPIPDADTWWPKYLTSGWKKWHFRFFQF